VNRAARLEAARQAILVSYFAEGLRVGVWF